MKKKIVNRILNVLAKIFVVGMCIGVVLVFGLQQLDFGVLFYFCMFGCLTVYLVYKKYNNKRLRFWKH